MKKIFTLLFVLASFLSYSQSTTVVISQVYSGGGSGSATVTYKNDYVELHNVSGTAQDISAFSLQYGSATGNFGNTATQIFAFPAATTIPAGGYLLVQLGTAGTAGANFPVTADFTSTNLSMGAAAGKVALVNNSAALGCGATATSCTLPTANIIDVVAWGTSNNAEGGAAVAALSITTGAVRKVNGCQDTDNNAADFDVATAPVPRNSASPISACGVVAPSLTITGTITDFGNVFVGSTSASQSYDLSGANLTGAPGTITVTAPSTDFQVSNDNTIWGASTTIAYASATLAATPVWVRFAPQSAGFKSGNVSNAGGGASAAVTIAVSGTGVTPATATLTATTLAAFGNVCVNSTAGPSNFTISGTNLTTADVTVGPLAGFTFSTTAGGTYTASLTLPQPGGTFSQQVFVNFTPIAIQSYNGNIDVAGGGAPTVSVAASGAGANNPPAVSTGTASAITTSTATISATITDNGCTAVSAYGIEYSTTTGFVNGTGTAVPSTNIAAGAFSSNLTGLTAATVYYYHVYATNAGGTTYSAEQTFTTATPVLTATALASFGSVCVNTISAPNSFTISSTDIGAANITVGPKAGFGFATTAAGPFSASLNLAHATGPYSQAIYVQFYPVAIQSYSGNIPVSGGGATPISVAVTASGNNATATVTTGTSQLLTPTSVLLNGSLTAYGCTAPSDFGFVYSGIDGFTPGYGTKVRKFDIPGLDYSLILDNLVMGTKYYYRAYAINDGGIAYGAQETFTTDSIPAGLIVYSSPITRGGNVHYTLTGVKPGHYQIKLINSVGQLVFQRELIVQLNFIDDNFTLPGNIGRGLYTLQVFNQEFKMNKLFMIQ